MSTSLRAALAGLALICAPALLLASSPTFWTVSTQADFLKGDVEDLSIDSDGRLLLGPVSTRLAETSTPFLWAIAQAEDGTVYAGTGNEGRVLKVTPAGKVSTFFDAGELEAHALALARNGHLYVGTSPDGRIYDVAPDGTSQVYFDPDDKYIWSLAVDRDGALYAATGDKGAIYKITSSGKGARFYKTSATNVVTLAFDREGNLLAGTESPGRLYRIDREGKGFVLLDSAFKELHAIRVGNDGTIYAAAFSATSGGEDRPADHVTTPPPTDRPPIPNVSTEITSIAIVDTSGVSASAAAPQPEPRRSAKGAIFRVRPDGLWDTVWESPDDSPFDLLIEADGALLVGTGADGKLFRVAGDPARATLLTRASARQITALLRGRDGRVIAATSNPGRIFALSSERATRGQYESDIRDAGTVATWGIIQWRTTSNQGTVELSSRSGNTATPDETWSPWSKAYTAAAGEPIASPKARYLQWRAVLKADRGGSPVLTSVTAAYLPRNLRPDVSSITVHPPGAVFQRPFSTGELEIAGFEDNTSDGRKAAEAEASTPPGVIAASPALGRRVYQKGLQTFVWQADDENDDRLQYDVYYRREGETEWKALHKGLWDPIFVWDTTSVPDGTYFVKVAASDAPSNSPGTALVGELESTGFDIDNTPPRIDLPPAGASGSNSTIQFSVTDAQSAVERVEYSLDASRWRVVYPVDGIPDSVREEFQIVVDEPAAAGVVIIRATDAMNNVATAAADIRK